MYYLHFSCQMLARASTFLQFWNHSYEPNHFVIFMGCNVLSVVTNSRILLFFAYCVLFSMSLNFFDSLEFGWTYVTHTHTQHAHKSFALHPKNKKLYTKTHKRVQWHMHKHTHTLLHTPHKHTFKSINSTDEHSYENC